MADPDVLRQSFLKPFDDRPLSEPVSSQGLRYLGYIVVVDPLSSIR
jgi:hypothetical protein